MSSGLGLIFLAFVGTSVAEKIGFPCTNEACQKKVSAYRLPICISLCAGWVCTSDMQPKLSGNRQSEDKIVVARTNTSSHKKTNAHRNPMAPSTSQGGQVP